MSGFCAERLRLPASHVPDAAELAPGPRRGRVRRFLKGPVPWDWLCVAFSLPGKAGAVGVALWYWHGMQERRWLKVSYALLASMGVNRYAARRALKALEAANLVKADRKPGRAPEVKLLDIHRTTVS